MKELQYLRFCLGIQEDCPSLCKEEWEQVYTFCLKHSLLGIGYQGLEKLSAEATIPLELKYQWIGEANQISNQNTLLNERCIELQRLFAEAGFATCILKGQGNALMYRNPLLRQSGDIDIWVTQKTQMSQKYEIRAVLDFLGTNCDIKKQVIGYHHVEFPLYDDVEIEVHWRPSWKSSPLHNGRMQRWFKDQSDIQFTHIDEKSGLHVPTWEFNLVYQLQHMYLHIFQEGLGLRQVVDYYYLLISDKRHEIKELVETLKYLDLYHFAGAIMYVLREALGMEEKYIIVPVDERRGVFLLDEIMLSGNFGRYDERNRELVRKTGISRSIARLKRQYRFLRDYPVEVLCAPFLVYHVIWRKLKLWRYC